MKINNRTTMSAVSAAFGAATAVTVPAGAVGFYATNLSALLKVTLGYNPAKATGTLTLTDTPIAAETVTIGGRAYTWVDELTTGGSVADEVLIAETAELSLVNFANALNWVRPAPGAGYSYATTKSAHVSARASALTLVVTALTGGTAGNSIGSTETMTTGSWGGATLSGGAQVTAIGTGLRPNYVPEGPFAIDPTAPPQLQVFNSDGAAAADVNFTWLYDSSL